ncbi:glycosyltransferase [Paenibacillus sp. S150]|uniref:glycosyltransferase n=1 Tax=Paenibacillus sp. S150 TaxID=2749826 RepID=UPI001C56EB9F|nr:glycosyltransferase family 2 protein [Paenibacillus sp. S150]MBW4084533.1 glycosyltransferase family 2 protein [Paenibacillus sp. S150]
MSDRIAIIILNYKNYYDTIECLKSIYVNSIPNSSVFLLDNGSPNESSSEIRKWLDKSTSIIPSQLKISGNMFEEMIDFHEYTNMGLIFIEKTDNIGFAKGNNYIIKKLVDEFDYFLLFNNDAICVNNAIEIMRGRLEVEPTIGAATCRINHYSTPEKLQQIGGRLTWYGHFRRYNESDIEKAEKLTDNTIKVTFASGCVLMLRSDLLKSHGLLSERIFFGEEDVELSIRYKRNNIKIASVIDAIVLHKGGQSQKTLSENYVDVAYTSSMVGRAIMLKFVYNPLRWNIWFFSFKLLMSANIIFRRRLGIKRNFKIMKVINKYVYKRGNMDKATYLDIVSEFKV